MLHQIFVTCPHAAAPARFTRSPGEASCTALFWRGSTRLLVLLVDRHAHNLGASVTNSAEQIIALLQHNIVTASGVPWRNVRWAERDSMANFDHIEITEWPDIGGPKIAFRPCGGRSADSFKNFAKALGFVVNGTTARQLQNVFDAADGAQTT